MFPLLKYILRRRAIRKYASKVQTGMIPLSAVRHAVVVGNAEEERWDECRKAVDNFFRRHGIKVEIYHIDTRRYKHGTAPETGMEYTLCRKNLNWFGKPVQDIRSRLLSGKPDLYICLSDREEFTERFLASAVPAVFKIGCHRFPEDSCNIIVTSAGDSGKDACDRFAQIAALLESVK